MTATENRAQPTAPPKLRLLLNLSAAKPAAKRFVLRGMKTTGLFRIARHSTRRGLRVLCYHALSSTDEHLYNPVVFMRQSRFRARMELIRRMRLPVISLDEILSGDYPDNAVVITFDDGWTSTLVAADIMQEFGYPSTLYVTTYYSQKQTQVFNMLCDYVLWKTAAAQIRLPRWNIEGKVGDPQFVERLLETGRTASSEERQRLCDDLSEAAVVDTSGLFRLMNEHELRLVVSKGMNIQLHTHRHRFDPDDLRSSAQEIVDNRRALKHVTSQPLRHFCYPSGRFSRSQFSTLVEAGIVTATTVKRGLNFEERHPYEISRFLDADDLSAIEFEAELSGVLDLLRTPNLAILPRRSFKVGAVVQQ